MLLQQWITQVGHHQKKPVYNEDVYDDGYFDDNGNWVYYADEETEEQTYDMEYWIVESTSQVISTTTDTVGSSSTSTSSDTYQTVILPLLHHQQQ